MSPISFRVQVAQLEAFRQAKLDLGHFSSNLARDESLTSPGALVVEQDAVAGKHVVCLSVVYYCPVSVQFCTSYTQKLLIHVGIPKVRLV